MIVSEIISLDLISRLLSRGLLEGLQREREDVEKRVATKAWNVFIRTKRRENWKNQPKERRRTEREDRQNTHRAHQREARLYIYGGGTKWRISTKREMISYEMISSVQRKPGKEIEYIIGRKRVYIKDSKK